MGKGLKETWGLREPSKKEAVKLRTEQGKEFNNAFRATLKRINGHLEFTAAHAEEARHYELTEKRELSYAAYHAAVKKIDPANPAVAKETLEQVTAAIQRLEASAKSLREQTEWHHTAWVEKEPEFDTAASQVMEMVEWGHTKGSALEQVVAAISELLKLRKYKEAVEALSQFVEKLGPIFAEFSEQADAKIAYDQMIEEKSTLLKDFKAVNFATLGQWQADIQANLDVLQQAARDRDYVTAFTDLEPELLAVEEFIAHAAELGKFKAEYDTALAGLQLRLDQAAGWEIITYDEIIDRLSAEMQTAAADEDFVLALETLNKLSPEVDVKLKLIDKSIYDVAARSHDATFTAAAATADEGVGPLVKANDNYKAIKNELDALVAAENWVDAKVKLTAVADAGQALIDLRADYDKFKAEEARLAPHFASLDGEYLSNLSGNPSPSPEWKEDVQLYRAYMSKPEKGNYKEATEALQALAPRIATLETRVNASDVEATAKADAAASKIRALVGGASLAGLSPGDWNTLTSGLRKLSFKKRTQLLEDLHAPSATLTNEQWLMQQAIYEATDLDKSFRKEDERLRQQYVEELKNNKQVQDALAQWNDTDSTGAPVLDRAAKEEILKQIIATQSKAYKVGEPEISWSPTQTTSAAEFKAEYNQILIDPASLGNAEEMVRAVLHENAHNFQEELKKQYLNGEIDARDPMYEQAKMFALNYSSDGYVTEAEHSAVYYLQPTEMHAHDVGDKGSMAVIFGI